MNTLKITFPPYGGVESLTLVQSATLKTFPPYGGVERRKRRDYHVDIRFPPYGGVERALKHYS